MPIGDEPASPFTCPKTVTIRRNPPRRARPTPSKPSAISSFPLSDILAMNTTATDTDNVTVTESPDSVSLKVFLRVRPPQTTEAVKKIRVPKMKREFVKSCIVVNDSQSVTVMPPACDSSRLKSEVYAGFSSVFDTLSSQEEVYDKMMRPIVEEFVNGRSGLLAALGPSGSGKTHTVFGSAKDPGLVPRALAHIFDIQCGNNSMTSRSFYLSVFEICMEKGKGEKLFDLCQSDGGDIQMQQSTVKGLKEVLIKDVAQAEVILAGAKLKRATAMTNSNSQSSRSQCIITIKCSIDEESESLGSRLTFVDLAGAERERKTGNQGGRLVESNFINNTSMVLGLCLRSLLEHQKNPKKPLQKHFQSSLLTRYLRDYLEGRKRMALILTSRSGPEDYFDASFLLRQASPYMEIKFQNIKETSKLPGNKRPNQMACSDKLKRAKLCNADEKNEVEQPTIDSSDLSNEEAETADVSNPIEVDNLPVTSKIELSVVNSSNAKLQRDYYVMQRFVEAFWNTLKQYKEKVKVMQKEINLLTENASIGNDRYLALEKELSNLKSRCTCANQLPINNVCSVEGTTSVSRVSTPQTLQDGLEEFLDLGPNTVHEAHIGDSLSPTKTFAFVDENTEQDANLRTPIEGAALLSRDSESNETVNLANDSKVKRENSHNTNEKDKAHIDDSLSPIKTFASIDEKPEQDESLRTPTEGAALRSRDSGSNETANMAIDSKVRRENSHNTSENDKAHIGDSLSPIKTFAFVNEKTEQDANLRTPIEGAALLSRDSESNETVNLTIDSKVKTENSHNTNEKDKAHISDSLSPIKTFAFVEEKSEQDANLRTHIAGAALLSRHSESNEMPNLANDSKFRRENSHNTNEKDKAHIGDSLSPLKTFAFVAEKAEQDANLKTPTEGAVLLSRDSDSNKTPNLANDSKENVKNTPRSNSKLKVAENSRNRMKAERHKRRLMPASSLLLRDAGSLDVMDDSVKHKGGKGGQRIAEDESKRSRGNASLLRLLKNHLPR